MSPAAQRVVVSAGQRNGHAKPDLQVSALLAAATATAALRPPHGPLTAAICTINCDVPDGVAPRPARRLTAPPPPPPLVAPPQAEPYVSSLEGLVQRLGERGHKTDKKALAQLISGLAQFMEDALGVNVSC